MASVEFCGPAFVFLRWPIAKTNSLGNQKSYIKNTVEKLLGGSVKLPPVHATVQTGYLITIAIEHLCRNGARKDAGVNAAFVSLTPARMVNLRVDVGIKTIFVRSHLVPQGIRLFCRETNFHNGFAAFKTVFPGQDDADRRSVLVRKDLAVAAKGKKS